MALNPWMYQGKAFQLPTDADPKNIQGFVYKITHVPTGKSYIGKKFFWSSKSKQVKGKRKKFKIESDWKEYCGSSSYLLADIEKLGVENFSREILHVCVMKAHCTYWETYEIFARHCLLNPDQYYNRWVSSRIRSEHLKTLCLKAN
jgi:hypothetical protein